MTKLTTTALVIICAAVLIVLTIGITDAVESTHNFLHILKSLGEPHKH